MDDNSIAFLIFGEILLRDRALARAFDESRVLLFQFLVHVPEELAHLQSGVASAGLTQNRVAMCSGCIVGNCWGMYEHWGRSEGLSVAFVPYCLLAPYLRNTTLVSVGDNPKVNGSNVRAILDYHESDWMLWH